MRKEKAQKVLKVTDDEAACSSTGTTIRDGRRGRAAARQQQKSGSKETRITRVKWLVEEQRTKSGQQKGEAVVEAVVRVGEVAVEATSLSRTVSDRVSKKSWAGQS